MKRIRAQVVRMGRSPRPRDQVWEDVSTVPAIADAIPAVTTCRRNGDRWRWEMDRYGALGLEVTPGFDVEATFDPPERVSFRPVGDVSEDATGRGWVLLTPTGSGTRIEVGVVVQVDVPIPGLLAVPLTKVMEREITKVVDGLLASLA